MAHRLPRGTTRVAGVIGDPVRHSLSPVLHNAAFAELDIDWVYLAFPVPRGRGADAVRAMPVLGIDGLSVTMPHKAAAAGACDATSPHAARLGVVNTVCRRPDATLWGTSTDGEGFLCSLGEAGVDPAGRRVLVLGAGGAARAVVLALGEVGARVTVAARRPGEARATAALASGSGTVDLSDRSALAAVAARSQLVVNATPVGMGGDGLALDVTPLPSGCVVADLVYHPIETPLLAAAAARGLPTVDGLGMLVHQAALAFELWTGCAAPVAVMREAARTVVAAEPPPSATTADRESRP